MCAAIVARLFRLAGHVAPASVVARALARAPRHRLVRAVTWYLRASAPEIEPATLLPGLRLVIRGWDDVYTASAVPVGARRADVAAPGSRQALVIRHARAGRGWEKQPLPTIGAVRPETELATRWLASAVGCILHDDCVALPELGAACANQNA